MLCRYYMLQTHQSARPTKIPTGNLVSDRIRTSLHEKMTHFLGEDIDNCTAHPHIQNVGSIELIFFPPNATSEIQPCDQGIIKTMQTYYRKSMSFIRAINNGSVMPDFKITLLDSLEMTGKAWESVAPTAIAITSERQDLNDPSMTWSGVHDNPFRHFDKPEYGQSEGDPLNKLDLD